MAAGFGAISVVGFVLAALVVWAAWKASGRHAGEAMPGASFDFQESWLSTFTAIIAVLGTLNISNLFASEDVSSSVLSLFFAVLVVAAPLVYKALVNADGKETVGGFVLASFLTLWATFGVIFTIGFVLDQINLVYGQQDLAGFLTMAVIVLLTPLVAAYAHGKLISLLKSQKSARGEVNFL